MLRQRILTAIVLLLIVAAAVTAPTPWPMLALLGLMTGCALWEWLRLVIDRNVFPPSTEVNNVEATA